MAFYFECGIFEDGLHVGNREPPPGTFCGWNYTAEERAEQSLGGHALGLAVRLGVVSVGEVNSGTVGAEKVAAWRRTDVEPFIRGDWYNQIKLYAQPDILSTPLAQTIASQYGNLTIRDWPGYPVAAPAARDYAAEAVAQLPGSYFTGDVSQLPRVSAVTPEGLLRPATPATPPPSSVPPSTAAGSPPLTEGRLMFLPVIIAGAGKGSVAGPVGLIIGAALGALSLILRGGGVNKETQQAISGLRGEVATITDTLQRWTWQIARSVGGLIIAIQRIWVRVLRPLIEKVQETIERVARIVDRVLRPYLDFLRRVRQVLLRIYEHYIAPVLVVIQKIRRVLAILAALRVPFARKLDQRLGQIEGKIAGVFLQVLGYVNHLGGWFNVLLNARLHIQLPIWVNSLNAYRGFMVAEWWNAQSQDLTAGERARLRASSEVRPLAVVNAELASYGRFGSGAYAASASRVGDQVRRNLPR